MRGLDRGESFVVTRNGVPVGQLIPLRQRAFVSTEEVVAAFAPPSDRKASEIGGRCSVQAGGKN